MILHVIEQNIRNIESDHCPRSHLSNPNLFISYLHTTTFARSKSTPRNLSFTMSADYKFQGWMGLDKSAASGNMKWQEYEPKKWEETDVDIQVSRRSDRRRSFHTDSNPTDHTLRYVRI